MADEQIAPSVGEHELVNEQPTSMLTDEENATNGAAVRTARGVTLQMLPSLLLSLVCTCFIRARPFEFDVILTQLEKLNAT